MLYLGKEKILVKVFIHAKLTLCSILIYRFRAVKSYIIGLKY